MRVADRQRRGLAGEAHLEGEDGDDVGRGGDAEEGGREGRLGDRDVERGAGGARPRERRDDVVEDAADQARLRSRSARAARPGCGPGPPRTRSTQA